MTIIEFGQIGSANSSRRKIGSSSGNACLFVQRYDASQWFVAVCQRQRPAHPESACALHARTCQPPACELTLYGAARFLRESNLTRSDPFHFLRSDPFHFLEHAIEVERLALIALQLLDTQQRSEPVLEKSFREALPKALRLVELTEEFLKQKEAEEERLLGHSGG